MQRPASPAAELLLDLRAGVATVTLNRPAVHNALSFGMLRELSALLDGWERDDGVRSIVLRGAGAKAFSAGGDMRALHRNLTSSDGGHAEYFRVEYALDYRIHTYPKPIVAVLDGIVMGGGMGLSQGAALRTVGPRTVMAMPETAIGVFPDVGGSYFLTRTPGLTGLYLGLTGVSIDAADAVYAGLADDFVPGYVSRKHGRVSPPSQLAQLQPAIDRHFSASSVLAIIESLTDERETQYRPWAAQTAALLRRRSPTMLEVTFEQLRRGASMTLAECLRMELNLVHNCFRHPDMLEGIRAVLIDKDRAARWSPTALEDVSRRSIEAFFAPIWSAPEHPLANLERQYGSP